MSSWIQRHAGSQQTQLAATAVLSGAAVAGAIFGYQALKRKEAVKELKASIPSIDDKHIAGKVFCFAQYMVRSSRLTLHVAYQIRWRRPCTTIEQGR